MRAPLEFPSFYTPFANTSLSLKDRERLAQPTVPRIPQYHRRAIHTREDQAAQGGQKLRALEQLSQEVEQKEMKPAATLQTTYKPSNAYITEQIKLADSTQDTLSVTPDKRTTPCITRRQSSERSSRSDACVSQPLLQNQGNLLTLALEGKSFPTATDHFNQVGYILKDMRRWDVLPGNSTLSKAQMVFCRGDRIYATIFLLLAIAAIVLGAHVLIKLL